MRTLLLPTKPVYSIVAESPDLCQAKREVSTASEQYKQSTIKRFKDGLEFGRACQQWQAKFKAQGSHNGKGFEHLLEHLGITKTTAYRWMKRYEEKIGLRASWNEVEHAPDSSVLFGLTFYPRLIPLWVVCLHEKRKKGPLRKALEFGAIGEKM